MTQEMNNTMSIIDGALTGHTPRLGKEETGTVTAMGGGIVHADGLPGASYLEVMEFPDGSLGMVFNLEPEDTAIVLFDNNPGFRIGDRVKRTGRLLDVPVGGGLLGRVIDPLGRPRDGKGVIRASERIPVERTAPPIMERLPVTVPLQTGIAVIDALIPIGRGQRQLILGDRQTGKTAIALDTIINQKDTGVVSVYCAIRQRSAAVSGVIKDLENHDVMDRSIVVVSTGDDTPGLSFAAPYAAASIAEYFMHRGRDVLVVYDDLTKHSRAYREISLLLRRPPAREAYPGDIFYIHSRLLERSTHLKKELGGGSMTALPICETQAENISAYIPTNLISITDGQIYHSPSLFQEGVLPAVDIGKSVSRVGGKTQLRAYRHVAGDLRLAYSQFMELESFSRFGTRLDEKTMKTLEHGKRVREILKQDRYSPLSVTQQIIILLAVKENMLDDIPLTDIREVKTEITGMARDEFGSLDEVFNRGSDLMEDMEKKIIDAIRYLLENFQTKGGHGTDPGD